MCLAPFARLDNCMHCCAPACRTYCCQKWRKLVAFLMERADDLDQAAKVSRLLEHMRNTGDNSLPRLAEILKWADGYVAELREASSAAAVERGAAEWGIW
jgi:hypothetical protein